MSDTPKFEFKPGAQYLVVRAPRVEDYLSVVGKPVTDKLVPEDDPEHGKVIGRVLDSTLIAGEPEYMELLLEIDEPLLFGKEAEKENDALLRVKNVLHSPIPPHHTGFSMGFTPLHPRKGGEG